MDAATHGEWWMALDLEISRGLWEAEQVFDRVADEFNFPPSILALRDRWVEYAECLVLEAIEDNRPVEVDEATLHDWLDRHAPRSEPGPDDWEP